MARRDRRTLLRRLERVEQRVPVPSEPQDLIVTHVVVDEEGLPTGQVFEKVGVIGRMPHDYTELDPIAGAAAIARLTD